MKRINVKGLSCGHCVAAVTRALQGIEGITDVRVDLEKAEATFNETVAVPPEVIREAIKKAGYEVD